VIEAATLYGVSRATIPKVTSAYIAQWKATAAANRDSQRKLSTEAARKQYTEECHGKSWDYGSTSDSRTESS
jgi:hypothetical protein